MLDGGEGHTVINSGCPHWKHWVVPTYDTDLRLKMAEVILGHFPVKENWDHWGVSNTSLLFSVFSPLIGFCHDAATMVSLFACSLGSCVCVNKTEGDSRLLYFLLICNMLHMYMVSIFLWCFVFTFCGFILGVCGLALFCISGLHVNVFVFIPHCIVFVMSPVALCACALPPLRSCEEQACQARGAAHVKSLGCEVA